MSFLSPNDLCNRFHGKVVCLFFSFTPIKKESFGYFLVEVLIVYEIEFVCVSFRAGLKALPHNAKMHYNFANFLRDSTQLEQAAFHYREALR